MLEKHTHHVRTLASVVFAACLLGAGTALAAEPEHHHHDPSDPHAHHRAMLEQKTPSTAQSIEIKLDDAALVTQDGERVQLNSDVIADKIVVMDFVYTTCTTVCPVLSAIFGQIQDQLGDRLDKEVILVSVSVDPTRDTPQRLKAYAARHQAREGWLWLTGQKPTVDAVLEQLGVYTPNFEDHPSIVLVGDGRSGQWTRFFGFPSPDQIMAKVDQLVAARAAAQPNVAAQE